MPLILHISLSALHLFVSKFSFQIHRFACHLFFFSALILHNFLHDYMTFLFLFQIANIWELLYCNTLTFVRYRKSHGVVHVVRGILHCLNCNRKDCLHVQLVQYAIKHKQEKDVPSVIYSLADSIDTCSEAAEWDNKYKSHIPIPFVMKGKQSRLLLMNVCARIPKDDNGTLQLSPLATDHCPRCNSLLVSSVLQVRRRNCSLFTTNQVFKTDGKL